MISGCGGTKLGAIGSLSPQDLCGAHTRRCQATPYPRYVKFKDGLPGFDGDPASVIGHSLNTKLNREPTAACLQAKPIDYRVSYEYEAKIRDETQLKSTTKLTVQADLAKLIAMEFPVVGEVIDLEAEFSLDRLATRIAEKSAVLTYQIVEATNSLWSTNDKGDAELACLRSHSGGAKSPNHIIGAVAIVTYDAQSKRSFSAELDAELKAALKAKAVAKGLPEADFQQKWERLKERVVDAVVSRNSYIVSYAWPQTC